MFYFQAKKKKKKPKKKFELKSKKEKKIVTKPSPWQAPTKAHGKPNNQQITKVPTDSPKKKKKTNTEQITKSEITSKLEIT